MFFMSPDIVLELGRQHRQQLLDEAEAERTLRAVKMASMLLKDAQVAIARSLAGTSRTCDTAADTHAGERHAA